MKKLIAFVMIFSVLFAVPLNVVAAEYKPVIPDASASEIAHDCDAIHSEIIDIEITPELYNRVYQEIGDKLPEIAPYACSHNDWSSWYLLDDYWTDENWEFLGDTCLTYHQIQYRFCNTCGEVQMRQVSTTFRHSWVETSSQKRCTICGLTFGIARYKSDD